MKRDELRALLAEAGVQPTKGKGQNFLVEENLADAIARDGEVGPEDVVLEVGTGVGVLTRRLVERAHHVVSVELDPLVLGAARRVLGEPEGLTLVEADALANKNALNPAVLEALEPPISGGRRLRVVANLPYAVATPLVVGLLRVALPLDLMVVMVQLEAAERFAARPGDPAYGAVSVLVAALTRSVRLLRRVPRDVFHPRPKVSSAVVRFEPDPAGRGGFAELSEVVRALFNYRRKTLHKAAKAVGRRTAALSWLSDAIPAAGIDPQRRPEDLGVEDFRAIVRGHASPAS